MFFIFIVIPKGHLTSHANASFVGREKRSTPTSNTTGGPKWPTGITSTICVVVHCAGRWTNRFLLGPPTPYRHVTRCGGSNWPILHCPWGAVLCDASESASASGLTAIQNPGNTPDAKSIQRDGEHIRDDSSPKSEGEHQ